MQTEINQALDQLEQLKHHHAGNSSQFDAPWRHQLREKLNSVQAAYLEVIRSALTLLVQNHQEDCLQLLRNQRLQLEGVKERIAGMVADPDAWLLPIARDAIEYLYTRARLVEELEMFPTFALDLLERFSFDRSLDETIAHLELNMTGKDNLFPHLTKTLDHWQPEQPSH